MAGIDGSALARLSETIGNNPEDLIDLIKSFLDEAPDLLSAMNAGGNRNDLKAVQLAAHSLKSNARDFGAVELSHLCETLEHDIRSNIVVTDIAQRISSIRDTWPEIDAGLLAEIAKLKARI